MATTKRKAVKSTKSTKSKARITAYKGVNRPMMFGIIALLAVIGVILVYRSHAASVVGYDTSSSVYDTAGQARLHNDPAHKVDYTGLKLVKKTANHPCRGDFEVQGAKPNGKPLCTHGPDSDQEIPVRPLAVASLVNGVVTNGIPYPATPTPCTSGAHRIQLVLISHADTSGFVPAFQEAAQRLEGLLEYSSQHSGAGSTNRHFRFVTNANCVPTVARVTTPTGTSLATLSNVTSYLSTHGYNDKYTKYLTWVYNTGSTNCGMATLAVDSQPNVTYNANNNVAGYGVVWPPCWSGAEAHELMHTLGAVQYDAPHTSGGGHCLDGYDVMCNSADGGNGVGVNGHPWYIAPLCATTTFKTQYDCNKNDYFNTGAVATTNYLYNHWNTAHSPYLQ